MSGLRWVTHASVFPQISKFLVVCGSVVAEHFVQILRIPGAFLFAISVARAREVIV